jgi:hypothetical protein
MILGNQGGHGTRLNFSCLPPKKEREIEEREARNAASHKIEGPEQIYHFCYDDVPEMLHSA